MGIKFDFKVRGGVSEHTNAAVLIVLKTWSDDAGTPRISEDLMTDREIDDRVQSLKAELDDIGRQAKAALKRANAI